MGIWISRLRTWYLPRLYLIRLKGLEPTGTGTGCRRGVTSAAPPRWTSFVWRNVVISFPITVWNVDSLRIINTGQTYLCLCPDICAQFAGLSASRHELHSQDWAEAATARAPQKAESNRHVRQHKVGSAKPYVTMHAGMHTHAEQQGTQRRATLQPQEICQRSESCDGEMRKMRSLQDDVHQRLQKAATGRLQSACRRGAEKNTD